MNITYPKEWLVIANRALNLVGCETIQNFTDSGEPVINVNTQLAASVQEVMARHLWRCARKRAELASVVETPAFGYEYAYQLPIDFCTIVRIEAEDVWEREGNLILTNSKYVRLVYEALPADPKSLSVALQDAITYLLAYKIGQRGTANDNLISRLYQEYMNHITVAIMVDNEGISDNKPVWWTEDR